MKRKLLFSTLALLCFSGNALAGGNQVPTATTADNAVASNAVAPVGWFQNEASCGCETPCDCEPCFTEPACGCEEVSCDGGCDGACGGKSSCLSGLMGLKDKMPHCDCELGDPFALFGEYCGYSAGGWVQMGYHDKAIPMFNSRPDNFQLHQAWLYAEKAIDTSGGFDIGGRIDYVYGTDAPDTQAFGIPNDHWDNGWDNGDDYGHALPQVYMEAGYGNVSVKVGHFFTLIGWEVVTAPDNFFYSHAYTMYNSEPFTHTGALATVSLTDDIEAYGGYTLGWDSGFEDNGDAFLGGISWSPTENLNLIYATTGGRFNDKSGGERGYMHSLVADVALTDSLQYIIQSDYLDSLDAASNGVRNTIGVNNYLIYTISDCVAAGGRFEWYNQQGVFSAYGDKTDIYALTLGVNVKPHANVLFRPEVRWDRDNGEVIGLEDGRDQATFGIDSIFLF